MGCRLLTRGGGQPIRMTPAGLTLLASAKAALDELETGLDAARRTARGESGLVRVGFTPSIALNVLPPIVQAFRARFPGVELLLSELPSMKQVEGIRADRLDVGFVRDPPVMPDLVSRDIMDEPLLVLLPRSHRLASGSEVALASLANESFVAVRALPGPRYRERFNEVCREVGFEPRIAQEAGEWATVAGLVSSGIGVAVAPSSIAQIQLEGLVHRPLDQRLSSQIVMLHRSTFEWSPAVHFVDTVQNIGESATQRTDA